MSQREPHHLYQGLRVYEANLLWWAGSLTNQTNPRVEYQVLIVPRVCLTFFFFTSGFSSPTRVRLTYGPPLVRPVVSRAGERQLIVWKLTIRSGCWGEGRLTHGNTLKIAACRPQPSLIHERFGRLRLALVPPSLLGQFWTPLSAKVRAFSTLSQSHDRVSYSLAL